MPLSGLNFHGIISRVLCQILYEHCSFSDQGWQTAILQHILPPCQWLLWFSGALGMEAFSGAISTIFSRISYVILITKEGLPSSALSVMIGINYHSLVMSHDDPACLMRLFHLTVLDQIDEKTYQEIF